VWREDPNKNNKWRAFRVNSEEEEKTHYNHVKTFMEVNAQ